MLYFLEALYPKVCIHTTFFSSFFIDRKLCIELDCLLLWRSNGLNGQAVAEVKKKCIDG